MIKRTLYFSNPAYLSYANRQLVVNLPLVGKNENGRKTVPVEDIGIVILDHRQITITQSALEALLGNNVAVIVCDSSHMPVGLNLPLEGNTLQSERFTHQINVSLPLKKQLWQQTVQSKIRNQAVILKRIRGVETGNMLAWATKVKSGDIENLEARAAAYYWKNMFPEITDYNRERDGIYPNNLLNYGYAILRAMVARALVSTGLLPTLGIHHHNRYNAYCLADDIMEPYRPLVDSLVVSIVNSQKDSQVKNEDLTTDIKKRLLSIPVIDTNINGNISPMINAVTTTAASLYRCFCHESRKIIYPEL